MASAALLLTGPAQIASADGGGNADARAQRDEAALPFSTADVGWVLLAAAVLLVLFVSLQLVARRRRRALRSLTLERADP